MVRLTEGVVVVFVCLFVLFWFIVVLCVYVLFSFFVGFVVVVVVVVFFLLLFYFGGSLLKKYYLEVLFVCLFGVSLMCPPGWIDVPASCCVHIVHNPTKLTCLAVTKNISGISACSSSGITQTT